MCVFAPLFFGALLHLAIESSQWKSEMNYNWFEGSDGRLLAADVGNLGAGWNKMAAVVAMATDRLVWISMALLIFTLLNGHFGVLRPVNIAWMNNEFLELNALKAALWLVDCSHRLGANVKATVSSTAPLF